MEELLNRVLNTVDICWNSFSAKVGSGLISINKEASMQLQYAYLLKSSIDLAINNKNEHVFIELETGIPVNGRIRECDILIHMTKEQSECFLPIEIKCYKTISSSGNPRGAQDLFRFGVYEDLQLLEGYAFSKPNTLIGIQLTMTDSRNFVYPKSKKGKSWAYDISNGTDIIEGISLSTPIGGKPASISLTKSYKFNWTESGDYFFLKLQGTNNNG